MKPDIDAIKVAIARGKVNADNENYCCSVTIKQAADLIDYIRVLEAALEKIQKVTVQDKIIKAVDEALKSGGE